MSDIIAYEFECEPVRVIMIAGDPWFVANDICRVLDIKNPRDAQARLEDDEKGVGITDTLGGQQTHNVVSESGMYALIFRSRKPDAIRFRKWVTGEVLPSLRRTGKYMLHEDPLPPELPSDHDPTRLMASVAVVREARRLFGPRSARSVWAQLGLPMCIADANASHDGDPLAEPLKEWLEGQATCTIEEAARGIGIDGPERSVRNRIGALLRLLGWDARVVRRDGRPVKLFARIGDVL